MVINAVEKGKTGKEVRFDTGGRGGPPEKTPEHRLEDGERMSHVGLGEQPPGQRGAQSWTRAGASARPAGAAGGSGGPESEPHTVRVEGRQGGHASATPGSLP